MLREIAPAAGRFYSRVKAAQALRGSLRSSGQAGVPVLLEG